MILRIALFALTALGLGGFATMAWIATRPPAPAVAAPPVMVKVLVAAHSLRAGNLLKPEDLSDQEMPETQVPVGATKDTPANRTSLFGAMIRHSLATNEPVLPTEIMRPGDHGFLAAVLGPGMRAVTVGVDAISGSAGLIWPGDRVDLILTQTLEGPAVRSGRRFAAETVLADARVIAIDQQLVQGASPDSAEPKAARTVTLEVTPLQAERVAVAEKLGHLSLVVRSADPATHAPQAPASAATDPHAVIWAGDVSPALSQSSTEGAATGTVRVFQGPSDGKEFHF